jgi:hypothetical protein
MEIEKEKHSIIPQEIITIFCRLQEPNDKQWRDYPELDEFFKKGYYIEDFKQTLIGTDRYMITFAFRKFNPSTY